MTRNQLVIFLASLTTLSGCFESRQNTDQLCESNPPLRCEKLNMRDGQCRIPRTDLIWHRYEALRNNTVDKQIEEYEILHEYQKCLELAAQIQPIDQTDLKERRFNALVHTYDEQKRIMKDLATTDDPKALYFRWSHGDDDAKRAFLQMEGTKRLETAEMQLALATYYANRDKHKTLTLLENALVLTKRGKLNTDIIKSLASINLSVGNREHAYIWAMVGREFDLPITSDKNLHRIYGFNDEKKELLDDIADDVASAIDSGLYRKELIPPQEKLK